MFSRAVNQSEAMLRIESENGYIDFCHDGAQQGRRFERPQTLNAQRFAKRIDFQQDLAERVVQASAARANRVIAFAQGGQEIAHGLERMGEVFSRAGDEAQETSTNDDGQGPLNLW